MNNSVKKNIPILIVVLLVICLFANHLIKKNAMLNSVDESLLRYFLASSGYWVDLSEDVDNEYYLIFTDRSIRDVNITGKDIDMGIFDKSVTVNFDATLDSEGREVYVSGSLWLDYNKEQNMKWEARDYPSVYEYEIH